ncbi:MAG TPA: hypothetical protein VMQ44_03285, partial [Candidatus Saccharimonadales bacterium]|nr:hypothetical protein [Candidatus Saccharimonadales bacterium]
MEEAVENIGKVESIFDGICVISGITEVAIDSVVVFPSGSKGLVIDFDDRFCSAIVFGDFTSIKKGDYVKVVDEQLKIPAGEELLGRIIDPLANPLDDLGDFSKAPWVNIKNHEKTVFERKGISSQLETGQLIIDSQIPIGLGQRELFIGERKIGAEDTAINILVNQQRNNSNLKVIYVAI